MRSRTNPRLHRRGNEEKLDQAEDKRLFRHFTPPARNKEAWWAQMIDLRHRKNYGLMSARKGDARLVGHTDEYVGCISGGPVRGGPWEWSVHMFGRRGGRNTPIIAVTRSLREAMRVLENAWMLGMLAEHFDKEKP